MEIPGFHILRRNLRFQLRKVSAEILQKISQQPDLPVAVRYGAILPDGGPEIIVDLRQIVSRLSWRVDSFPCGLLPPWYI